MLFVGEPWDDAVLAHSEAKSIYRDATTFPQSSQANQPIKKSALAHWQRDMSDDDRRIFKEIAGETLIEFGYARDMNW